MKNNIIKSLSFTAIFFSLSLSVQADEINRLSYTNNLDEPVYLVTKSQITSSYVADSILGWIHPFSEGYLMSDNPWFLNQQIDAKSMMSFGFMDGSGNIKVCAENIIFNTNIEATLRGGLKLHDPNTVCELKISDEPPIITPLKKVKVYFRNRFDNEMTQYVVGFNEKNDKWERLTLSIGGPGIGIGLEVNIEKFKPKAKVQFGVVTDNMDGSLESSDVVLCDEPREFTSELYFAYSNNKECHVASTGTFP